MTEAKITPDDLNVILVAHGARSATLLEGKPTKLPEGLTSKQVFIGNDKTSFTIVAKEDNMSLIPKNMSEEQAGIILGYLSPTNDKSDEMYTVEWHAQMNDRTEIPLYIELVQKRKIGFSKILTLIEKYTTTLKGKQGVRKVVFKLVMGTFE